MPIDYADYHPKWSLIVRLIRKRTIQNNGKDCCEGSPAFPDCRAENHEPHPITGSVVVLTTAHIDQDKENNRFHNLGRWCQRCHLYHDRHQHARNRKYGRYHKRNQLNIFK